MSKIETVPTRSMFPEMKVWDGQFLSEPTGEMEYPGRVRNRMYLHKIGACNMYTTIVNPDVSLGKNDLRKILGNAKETNDRIGLSTDIHDLFIRSRDVPPIKTFHNSQENKVVRLAGTNPALWVKGIHTDSPEYIQIKSEFTPQQTFKSVAEWRATLKPSFLLVHEENYKAQCASIHGRIMRLPHDGTYELSLGDNVPHARMIGLNGGSHVSLSGHDLDWLIESTLQGSFRGMSTCSSTSDAYRLVNKISGELDRLKMILEKVDSDIGEGTVLEFRVYQLPWRAGLEVYDFDKRFNS